MTQQERRHIAAGLAHGLSYAEIARRLDRPTSTISREIARNGGAHAYRPDRAHRATADRAHRAAPAPARAAGRPREATGDEIVEIVEIAVRSGMPRMTARVHVDLLLSEDGRRTPPSSRPRPWAPTTPPPAASPRPAPSWSASSTT
ncbi:helix-turn-helix domain-containing protein [Streptomyces sp. NPDC007818]|uniref:helix-turn-helix domain-containing protein n=1 Tax=Streptomyces sp. NPDC007818 TaxID=3364780 RepID=UPI0036C14104